VKFYLRLNQIIFFFRYKRPLQKANGRSSEFTILSRTVLGRRVGASDHSLHRCVNVIIRDWETLSHRMDKSISLCQRAGSIGNAFHSNGHSVLRNRSLTKGFYRICTRVSRSSLREAHQ